MRHNQIILKKYAAYIAKRDKAKIVPSFNDNL